MGRYVCPNDYPYGCTCRDPYCKVQRQAQSGRQASQGKSSYGRGSTSGAYGRSGYSFESATFDGLPALKRRRPGVLLRHKRRWRD